MSPERVKKSNKVKRMPTKFTVKADAFSFGLSILEMGNLLNYKNIKLNKD